MTVISFRRSSAITQCAAVLLTLASGWAFAANIADEVRQDEPSELGNGGFLELGAILRLDRVADTPTDPSDDIENDAGIGPSISFGYRYNNLFIEATESDFDGLNLGYTLWHNPNWTVDFLAANLGRRGNHRK